MDIQYFGFKEETFQDDTGLEAYQNSYGYGYR